MSDQIFFIITGILSIAATVGLVYFMLTRWPTFDRDGGWAQRLRFITLLYFAVVGTAIVTDQVTTNPPPDVDARALAFLVGAALLALTAYTSLKETRTRSV